MSAADARAHLDEIARSYNAADEEAPIVGWAFWAERRARRSIRNDRMNLEPETTS